MLWIARKCINADWGQTFECVQNICNTQNHVILSNPKEKWSYERLSIIRRWVGRGGFLLPFWQVTCECVCRWGQEHQLLGGRWYQATTFYPLVEQTQTLEKMPALIPLVILLGGLDGDKEKEVVQDRCHQGGRWSQLLIYNLQLLYSGKRCLSVIDVSSCYSPPDIEDSPVSGNGGK